MTAESVSFVALAKLPNPSNCTHNFASTCYDWGRDSACYGITSKNCSELKKQDISVKRLKLETSKFRISKMALQNLTIFYLLFTCFCCGAAVNLDSLTSMVYLDEWCGNTDRLPSSAFVARTSRRMCSLQDFARNLATSFCLILTNPPDLSWAVCSHGGRDGCQQWL